MLNLNHFTYVTAFIVIGIDTDPTPSTDRLVIAPSGIGSRIEASPVEWNP